MKILPLLFLLTAMSAFADGYTYNCTISLKDAKSGTVLGNEVISTGYNQENVTPNPPGNASCLLVQENETTGIVASFDASAPQKSFSNPHPQGTISITLFRRVGFDGNGTGSVIQDSGPGTCNSIPYITDDTPIGTISAKGTQIITQQFGTYSAELSCQQQ
jgi:hypothetical protein